MKQHILFFDIDGTIVDEATGVVPESTKKAILQARENGHILMLNTGRCRVIWPQEILDLGFHGAIGGCGTYIEYQGEEIFHTVLSVNLCLEIVKDLKKWHIDGVLEAKEKSYFRKDIFFPTVKRIFEDADMYGGHSLADWEEPGMQFDKMALWYDAESDMQAFKRKYEKQFDFIKRDETFYEVVPRGYSKASGMKYMIEKLNIPWENTIAVGDSANDIPMFEYAALSIGMKSERHGVLEYTDYITDSVMNDGIYKAFCHYRLI